MERLVALELDGRVLAMAAEMFEADPASITGATTPDDIEGWDSLAMLNLLVALEDEFGISLPPDEFGEARSIAEIVSIVASHVA